MIKTIVAFVFVLVSAPMAAYAGDAADATLFRVFLRNGTALTSYGEYARVGGRIVFSMPLAPAAASDSVPPLHLVTLPESAVDWTATDAYAESARYARYVATRGDLDYVEVNNYIARTLTQIAAAKETPRRLELALGARRALADWPGARYGYRAHEIAQIGAMLDEVIAELRAESGGTTFDLSFVATVGAPPPVRLLPAPSERELAEQAVAAAQMADDVDERLSLLESIAAAIHPGQPAEGESASWRGALHASITAEVAAERQVDAQYDVVAAELRRAAAQRARRADVAGVEKVLQSVDRRDRWLGRRRPNRVRALIESLHAELEAAQRLQLARDRWALRLPHLRRYHTMAGDLLDRFEPLRPKLEDIRRLAGTPDLLLARVIRTMDGMAQSMRALTPPEELAAAHALVLSALELASTAARVRRDAVQSGSLDTARDASSAAAGALMLMAKAREDIAAALRPPDKY